VFVVEVAPATVCRVSYRHAFCGPDFETKTENGVAKSIVSDDNDMHANNITTPQEGATAASERAPSLMP
jgi:hypothetical protein